MVTAQVSTNFLISENTRLFGDAHRPPVGAIALEGEVAQELVEDSRIAARVRAHVDRDAPDALSDDGLEEGTQPSAVEVVDLALIEREDTQAWDAIVTCGEQAFTLWVEPGRTSVDKCRFTLHGTDAVGAATLVEALTRTYGPWLLYDVSSGKPVLVLPGSDPREIAAKL